MWQIFKNSGFEDLKFGDRGQDYYGFIDPDKFLTNLKQEQEQEQEPEEELEEEPKKEEETQSIKKKFKPLDLIKKAFSFFRKK